MKVNGGDIKEFNLKRDNIVRTRCIINNKVCKVIIDYENSGNLVFKALEKSLNLKTKKLSSFYQVSQVKRAKKFKYGCMQNFY